jgi:hypothetical protein
VRAIQASGLLEVRLLKKFVQRPLMSVWEGEDKTGARVLLTVVDACGTPPERDRLIAAAEALRAISGTQGLQNVRVVLPEVDAFVSDFHGAGTAADLVVLRLSVARRMDFVSRVCEALSALHAAGLVHGCLCPDNIQLDDDLHPVVTEAGMVSISGSLEGDPENYFGYGAYAAPETVMGDAPDVRGDVFSVGRLITFVLLDRAPGDPSDFADLQVKTPTLAALMRRCTGPAQGRFESIAALSAELDRCRHSLPSEDEGSLAPPPPVAAHHSRIPRPPTPALAFKPTMPDASAQRGSPVRWLAPLGAIALAAGIFAVSRMGSVDANAHGDAARAAVLRGDKDLRGKKLQGVDLSGLDLSGAQLDNADLSGASFAGSHLDGAHVDGASLVLAHFEGAVLTGVTVTGAIGVETAFCDAATVVPAGWHCSGAGKLTRGPAR